MKTLNRGADMCSCVPVDLMHYEGSDWSSKLSRKEPHMTAYQVLLSVALLALNLVSIDADAATRRRASRDDVYTTVITRYIKPLVEREKKLALGLTLGTNRSASCALALSIYQEHDAAQVALIALYDSKDVPRWARKAIRKAAREGQEAVVRMNALLDEANCRHES